MLQLRYTSEALDNLADIAAYIVSTSDSEALAERLVESLRRKCRKMADLPGTLGRNGPELGRGLRSVAHRNYVIFFRYHSATLEIVAVLEGHRDIVSYFADDEP